MNIFQIIKRSLGLLCKCLRERKHNPDNGGHFVGLLVLILRLAYTVFS